MPITPLPTPGVTPANWGQQLNDAIDSRYQDNRADVDVLETLTTSGRLSEADLDATYERLSTFNVMAYGATGNGSTDDYAAVASAVTAAAVAGGVVFFPSTVNGYKLGTTLILADNVTLRGVGRVRVFYTGAATTFVQATGTEGVRVEGLTLDAGTAANAIVLNLGTATDVRVTDCTLTVDPGVSISSRGVLLSDGASDVRIEDNTFLGIPGNSIKVDDRVTNLTIRGNVLDQWGNRGIYVLGTATGATRNVVIENNRVVDGTYPADPAARQPITFQSVDASLHENVSINGNVVVGRGTAHSDVVNPGTADQISLHRVKNFVVSGNVSTLGGDGGITVAQQCRAGVVSNNVCEFNGSCGLLLGSASTTSLTDLTISGNTFRDNGQHAVNDWAKCGINVRTLDRGTIVGNTLVDTGGGTQVAGISYGDTGGTGAGLVHVGPNQYGSSNRHLTLAANTGMTFTDPPLRATHVADQTVNNSTALVDITGLVKTVDAYALYRVELYLPYSSSTVADLKLGVVGPAGSTFEWVSNSPATNITGPNATIARLVLSAASAPGVGGTGGQAVGLPVGWLTTLATSGTFKVQFAQDNLEVSDTKVLAGARLMLTRVA